MKTLGSSDVKNWSPDGTQSYAFIINGERGSDLAMNNVGGYIDGLSTVTRMEAVKLEWKLTFVSEIYEELSFLLTLFW